MVKLNKIYTKTGDAGETGLVGTSRVAKASLRVEAMGAVDEANSALGLTRLHTKAQPDFDDMLNRIQHDLFDLGADLATLVQPNEADGRGDSRGLASDASAAPAAPSGEAAERNLKALRIIPSQVTRLENEIDTMNAQLAPLTSFILPGGNAAAAALFFTRATVRRAERVACALAAEEAVGPQVVPYLNRLSDHLFVMARAINGSAEVLWKPGVNR